MVAVNTENIDALCDDMYLNTVPSSQCVVYYTARPFPPISRLVYLHTTFEGASQVYVFFEVTSERMTAVVRFTMMRPSARWLLDHFDEVAPAMRCSEATCA